MLDSPLLPVLLSVTEILAVQLSMLQQPPAVSAVVAAAVAEVVLAPPRRWQPRAQAVLGPSLSFAPQRQNLVSRLLPGE